MKSSGLGSACRPRVPSRRREMPPGGSEALRVEGRPAGSSQVTEGLLEHPVGTSDRRPRRGAASQLVIAIATLQPPSAKVVSRRC